MSIIKECYTAEARCGSGNCRGLQIGAIPSREWKKCLPAKTKPSRLSARDEFIMAGVVNNVSLMKILNSTVNSFDTDVDTTDNVDHKNDQGQEEWEKASNFSCTCQHGPDSQPCYKQFAPEEMIRHRLAMKAMTPREQMLVLLGKISCNINMSEMTCASKRKVQKVRKLQRTNYWLEAKAICRETFKFLHSISQDRLTRLIKHYKENGLQPLEKKSGGIRKSNMVVYPDLDY